MEENENNWSIYIHINKINNKKYVGITSRPAKVRWEKNGSGYKPYYGHRNYMWNAIQKYGWDNFEHIIIQENLTKDQANEMERRLIAYYDSANPNNGYNIQLGGNAKGCQNESTKKLISDIQKKTVYRYDRINGQFIDKYESTLEVENILGIANANVSAVCLGKVKTAFGYYFSYIYYENGIPDHIIKWINTNNCFREILQYDLEGNFINKYNSIVEAVNNTSTSKSSISGCLGEKNKIGGNFIWRYYNDTDKPFPYKITVDFDVSKSLKSKKKEIILFDNKNTKIKSFKTAKSLAEFIGVSPGAITYSMKHAGKIKNYLLKYA